MPQAALLRLFKLMVLSGTVTPNKLKWQSLVKSIGQRRLIPPPSETTMLTLDLHHGPTF